jgi:hypothetical protein
MYGLCARVYAVVRMRRIDGVRCDVPTIAVTVMGVRGAKRNVRGRKRNLIHIHRRADSVRSVPAVDQRNGRIRIKQ